MTGLVMHKSTRTPHFVKKLTQNVLLCAMSMSGAAWASSIGDVPVIGGLFNSTNILKNYVVKSVQYSTVAARDTTLFTIGGVALDVYLLSLPLDSDVKSRVILQLKDPRYAIPLGYFLYNYYDRYTDIASGDQFKKHLQSSYPSKALMQLEHDLFTVKDDAEKDKQTDEHSHHGGLKVDAHFIAAMVTIYDALVQIDEWKDSDTLPPFYRYLDKSDSELVDTIQPVVVNIITSFSAGMEEGEMKSVLGSIVEDAKPENADKVNNRAQALTVTLIDFVRLNVLKAYRQFLYQQEREEALEEWMQSAFNDDVEKLTGFLQSQQTRRLAVQVVVDGLQQGLMQGLVGQNRTMVSTAYQRYQERESFEPNITFNTPEHIQKMNYLKQLTQHKNDDPNYLPFFKTLYQEYPHTIARVGVSSTPTISVRNLPIVKTGAKVSGKGGTGIPNFHFVDRNEDRAYYFFGNDALQLDKLVNQNGMQTMFDRLNYLKTLNCNGQYDWNAHVTYDGLVNLGMGESSRDFGEKRCLRELENRATVEVELAQLRRQLLDDITDYQELSSIWFITKYSKKKKIQQDLSTLAALDINGMPDFLLVYNPWPDHFAHFKGPFSDEIISPTGELNRLDYWMQRLEKTYREAGVYSQTLWGMAGDHGLSPVYYSLNPEKHIFEALEKQFNTKILVEKISSDEGEGPKMTNAINYPSMKSMDVVVASTAGGNFMMDFFNAQAGWETQPIYEELKQWRPNLASKSVEIDIVDQIVTQLADSLDYLVVREDDCSLDECAVRVVSQREGKRVDEVLRRIGDKAIVVALNGHSQLLGLSTVNPYLSEMSSMAKVTYHSLYEKCVVKASESNKSSWCTQQEWRLLTQYTSKPDVVNQLLALYEEPRAGTINLFPSEGIGFNTIVPGRHAGESYLEKDAFIGFWGDPIGSEGIGLNIEENGSLAPTLYEYLTGDNIVVGEDGWGYPSLLDKLSIQ